MDRDADFTEFVVAWSARLVHIAHMLCGDRDLAEDMVQSALERAYLRWDRIEFGDLFGHVRRAVVNHQADPPPRDRAVRNRRRAAAAAMKQRRERQRLPDAASAQHWRCL